jgi:hypothetical protein
MDSQLISRRTLLASSAVLLACALQACTGSGCGVLPDVTAPMAINDQAGTVLTSSTTPVLIHFNKSMNPTSLHLIGTLAANSSGGVWSSTWVRNDTLTFSPKTVWPVGENHTLSVDVEDLAGNGLTLEATYFVPDWFATRAAQRAAGRQP